MKFGRNSLVELFLQSGQLRIQLADPSRSSGISKIPADHRVRKRHDILPFPRRLPMRRFDAHTEKFPQVEYIIRLDPQYIPLRRIPVGKEFQ